MPNREAGTWDAVVVVDLLHRHPDPLGFLHACRERLAPDGVVLIDEPLCCHTASSAELKSLGCQSLLLLQPRLSPFAFTPAGLLRLLARAGFRSILDHRGTLIVAAIEPREPLDPGSASTHGARLVRALLDQQRLVDLAEQRVRDERRIGVRQLADVRDAIAGMHRPGT